MKYFAFVMAVVLVHACGNEEGTTPKPKSTSLNKILPLGASRVEGFRPHFESYRYELWKVLKENDWVFDFIGTRSDATSYPTFDGEAFDVDHEGRGGFTSGEILQGLDGWLTQTGPPDIVLFSSPGGNDMLDGRPYNQSLSNIRAIIDRLQAANPEVTIIIEQPAQGRSDFMTTTTAAAFVQMRQDVLTIAAERSTATSQVLAVDMFTGFSDGLLADEVHYNQAGAEFIASRYYRVLEDVLEVKNE